MFAAPVEDSDSQRKKLKKTSIVMPQFSAIPALPKPSGSRTGVLEKTYSGTSQSPTAKVSDSLKRPLPLSSPVTPKFLQSAIVRLWKYPCPAEAEALAR
jgi:hypothetical protein